jgi:hypothetical protein
MTKKCWPVAAVTAVVALVLTGCTAETPDSAYLSTLREAEPALVDVPDEALIGLGKSACDIFEKEGFDRGFATLVAKSEDNGISSAGAGMVAGAATGAYCPEYASEFE